MGIVLSDKIIDRYFSFLKGLDHNSKKKLISMLKQSMTVKNKKDMALSNLSGAWQDSRDSDEIINEIKMSRIEKKHNIDFE